MLDTIELAEMLGLGGIELMNFCRELKTPDIDGAARLFNAAKEKDLYVPCLTVNSDILASPDETAETLKKYADICAELGIKYLHHTIAKDFHCYNISEELKTKAKELGIDGPHTSWKHMFWWNMLGCLCFGPMIATYRFFRTLNKVESELNKCE